MRHFRRSLLLLLLTFSLVAPPTARADSVMREFIMSCTYGVLAGTLVGAAMLAFTNQPGENMQKVARGASLGLYAGILLGLYVVYVVPGEPNEQELLNGPSTGGSLHWERRRDLDSRFALVPTLDDKSVPDGAGVLGKISF